MVGNHSIPAVHTTTERVYENELDCRAHDSLWIHEGRIDQSELKLLSRNGLGDYDDEMGGVIVFTLRKRLTIGGGKNGTRAMACSINGAEGV